ncbi:MAG: XRE family transcriptional regulator [Spirochaetae bacterium HGW-Spirochaetae-1]|jgi:transcriptional regulator with XRE-family HTH domain|nr:MAG: XRE family transcriptional regulator [Spirochaetae bacterium HGW-Spirochaetae-1]
MKSKVKSAEYDDFLHDLSGYYQGMEKDEERVPLGKRLKELRELQGMKPEELARMAGIDVDLLRKIEGQSAYPNIETVIRLSKALRIAMALLLGDKSGYSYSVVRKKERRDIARHISGTKDHPDYNYQSLASGVRDRHMNSFIVTLTGKSVSSELSSHDGEEFIMVLEGTIIITLGNREERLETGDSIYYLSDMPHRVSNAMEDRDAVLLAVVYEG